MCGKETGSGRGAEAPAEQRIRRGTQVWASLLALILLWFLSPVVGDPVALLGLVGTAAVCWTYERYAAGSRHQAVTALLFGIGANLALAAANLTLLRLPFGSAIRPMGLEMANVTLPIVSGVIGAALCVRGAVADHRLWRLLSVAGLWLSLVVYHVGQFCFMAAVHSRGLTMKP